MMKSLCGRPLLLAASLALLGACGDAPTQARSCELPATTIAPSALEGMTAAHIRAGLDDAVSRLAPTVFPTADRAALRTALADVSSSMATADRATACIALREARTLLDRAPVRDDTSPDHAILRIVVDVTTAFLTSRA